MQKPSKKLWTTVDWAGDSRKEFRRRLNLLKLRGVYGVFLRIWDSIDTLLLLSIIGIACGFVAAFIDVGEAWLTDLKFGYCSSGWLENEKSCCAEFYSNSSNLPTMAECPSWTKYDPSVPSFLVFTFFAVLFASTSAYLCTWFPMAAGSGIPEVKTVLSGFDLVGFLSPGTLITKCVGLTLSVASGLSLGKEGPSVHVSCCIAYIIAQVLPKFSKNEANLRQVLSCACAAGVAVAFGAPIGGILFSLEEVSFYFPYATLLSSFYMAMIAVFSIQFLDPFGTGRIVEFLPSSFKQDWHFFELPAYALIGLLGGLFGAFFISQNVRINAYRKASTWLHKYPVSEAAAATLLTSLLSYPIQFLRISSSSLTANLFKECDKIDGDLVDTLCQSNQASILLLITALTKAGLTVITFGLRLPAGIFIPSMAVGACFGRIIGILMQEVVSRYSVFFDFCSNSNMSGSISSLCVINPGAYAIIGAAAALGGVTRMTVSLVVIMFELTGALSYILPLMTAILIAKVTAEYFGRGSIYEEMIELNKYPFLKSTSYHQLARDAMIPLSDVRCLYEGMSLDAVRDACENDSESGFVILDNRTHRHLKGGYDAHVLGYVTQTNLIKVLDRVMPIIDKRQQSSTNLRAIAEENVSFVGEDFHIDLSACCNYATPIIVRPDSNMRTVLKLFRLVGITFVLVCKEGRFLGMIRKKDLLRNSASIVAPRTPKPKRRLLNPFDLSREELNL